MTLDLDALVNETMNEGAAIWELATNSKNLDLKPNRLERVRGVLRAALERVRAASLAEGAAAERERCARIVMGRSTHDRNLTASGKHIPERCPDCCLVEEIRAADPGEGR